MMKKNGSRKRGFSRAKDDEDRGGRKTAYSKRRGGVRSNKERSLSGDDLGKVMLADLARSGLGPKDLKKLQLEPLDREQTDEFVGESRASYRIPYFDLEGKKIAYSRVRFLETRKKKVWGKTTRDGGFRYSQPFNSSPHVYFPPYFNWKKIAKDVDTPILITEGEKKAACACSMGIACIALGGVYGFKSGKRFYDLIPELELVRWKDRVVEICFDADVMLKSEVHAALSTLATTLTQTYSPASLEFVFLNAESGAGSKTGLDDFLVEFGIEKFQKVTRTQFRANAKVQLMNELVCYVEKYHRFFDIANRSFFQNLFQMKEAFMHLGKELIDAKRYAYVPELWAESANRRTVKDVIYLPGGPEVTEDDALNLWKAPGIQPRKGTPKRWLDLVHFVMREPEYAKWFLKWLAYPVQNPGSKLYQAVFVHGEKQGIGKTFVVDPIMEFIYGKDNFHRLQSNDLTSKHNTYARGTCFVVTNEVWLPEFKDRRSAMSTLKDMITRERVTIDEKYQPMITYDDHVNYYFTSNHADALVLDRGDRRFFVIEAPKKKLSQSEYNELDDWVRNHDGASVILRHLQNLDIEDFDPRSDAMRTRWRDYVVDLSKDPLSEFVEKVVTEPDLKFMVNGSMPDLELFRAEDLVRVFEHSNPKYRFNVTAHRMGQMLRNLEIEKRKVRVDKDSAKFTLYSVFEREKWHELTNKEWAEHYSTSSKIFGGKSRY